MNYTIIDNGVSSSVKFNAVSSPFPITYRIRYQNGKLIIDNEFAFSNLASTLGYTLDNEQTLNFNFDEYNTPDSITLQVGLETFTLTNNKSKIIESNVDITITTNRANGLPLIVKNINDEEVINSSFTGAITITLNNNTFYSSTGLEYHFTEFEDKGRDYVSYLLDETTEQEISTSLYINSNKAIILKQVNATDYMEIIFYQNNAENNRVNKNAFLTEKFRCFGTLKERTSIIAPSILIEYNLSINRKIFDCNYCYIPKFNRYYYIQNVVSEYTNLFTIELKVDVLMSYKTDILNQVGLVSRNEYNYDNELIDSKMIQEIDYDIDIVEYDNTLFNDVYAFNIPSYVLIVTGRKSS